MDDEEESIGHGRRFVEVCDNITITLINHMPCGALQEDTRVINKAQNRHVLPLITTSTTTD